MVEVFFGEQTSIADRSALKFFVDGAGNDVRGVLPGWPPSRDPHGLGWVGLRAGRFVVRALPALSFTSSDPPSAGQVADEATERRRLVVLQGDPGSVAWTVPWQLDQRLRPAGCTVVASAVNRVLTLTVRQEGASAATWSSPVVGAEVRRFGGIDTGLRVHFADRSWVRLDSLGGDGLASLASRLGPLGL